jgi:hypothetical protein
MARMKLFQAANMTMVSSLDTRYHLTSIQMSLSASKNVKNIKNFKHSESMFRLYTTVFECEQQITCKPLSCNLLIKNLKKQGITDDIMSFLSNKLSQVLEATTEATAKMVSEIFCTLGWILGRLPRVFDYYDVFSILDYVTRVHFGKPVASLIISVAFDATHQVDAQSMDWSVLKDMVSGYKTLKNHPAVIKFIKVISLAFSGGIFATMGVEANLADLWKVISETTLKIVDHTDFISAIIDLFHFIGERISAFCITGSWKTLLHTPTSYSRWADASFDCLDKSAALSNPGVIGLDYHKYMKDLSSLIEQGDEIKKYVRAADEKDAVSQVLSKLRSLYIDILIKNACGKMRLAPFSVLVSAGSSVGKSSFMDTLIMHYAKLYSKPLGDEFIYTRTAQEDHWNSFKASMWCLILDDIASINPNKGTSDPSLSDVLNAIGNFGFSPPQAAIEDKGRTPFMCELVMASTNTEDLKAHNWFNNPQAIRRRFPYVVNIVPQEAYRIPGTNMLDVDRLPPTLPGHYPDYWDITVKHVTVDVKENIEMKIILITSSIYEFIEQYNLWIEKHRNGQALFMASKQNSKDVVLCPVHKLPKMVCPCPNEELEPQAGDEDEKTSFVAGLVYTGAATAASYGLYKSSKFVADCAGVAVAKNPTLMRKPIDLCAATATEVKKKAVDFANAQIGKLVVVTRANIKKILQKAIFGVFKNYKPILNSIMIGLTTIAGLGLTWRVLRREFPDLVGLNKQVNIEDVGVLPEVKKEKENVWRKNDYVASEFLGRLATSWSSLSLTKVSSLVSKNVVWCRTTHSDTKHTTFRALCVAGHLYVVPNHVLPVNEYFMLQVIHENDSEGCNGNVSFKVSQKMIYRLPDKEIAFFEINHMPVRRNLTEVLPKAGFDCDAPARMIVRMSNGSTDFVDSRRSHLQRDQFLDQFGVLSDIVVSHVLRDTVSGECGSPVVVQMPNSCSIVGIHCLGGERNLAISLPVTQELVALAVEHFQMHIVEAEIPFLEGQNFTTDISQRCTARFVDEGVVQVYGSFNSFKRQPKSTACDTLFTSALIQKGRIRKFGPAPMKGYTAVHIALKAMVQKEMLFKEDVLRKCSDSFVNHVWKNLPNNYKDELKNPLPLKVALNGYPGTKFIDSMNFGTSAGYPYNKSKRNFVTRVPADEVWQHPVVVNQQIRDEIDVCWNNMINGISCSPIFMQHLKDEALPLRKVAAGKARVHMGGPFAWSTCVRMLLLPFIRVMQWNKYLFECAPGTNTTSIEWTRLYKYLTKFGVFRMIAGDFESFDKLMGSLVILEAFRMIKEFHKRAGADLSVLRAIQVVAEDVAFAFVSYNGDLMQFFGSNPSGHPLTVIINCLVNSLYMRYCYHELNPVKEVESFPEFVRLITYGDDNTMGSGVDWFNHTSVAQVLATVGVKYTMADKLAVSVPFISISEVSFLKREFMWNDELDAYMAPLDSESIWKSLMIFVPSSTDSPQKQCLDIVRSAVEEWFFYGRERFEKEKKFLEDLVNEVGLNVYVEKNTFSDWDVLKERFIDCSRDYLATEPSTSSGIIGDVSWKFYIQDGA